MKTELTERQQEILSYIEDFIKEFGYAPTYREIGTKFEIASTFGVRRHLDALVKKGYLVIGGSSRAITLLKQESANPEADLNSVPIIGRVAAGSPILAEQNHEGSVVIDPSFRNKSRSSFALKVKGDSMINAGIFEGDLVIVAQGQEPVTGDIVVAMIGDEATVKTFKKGNNKIILVPENEKYAPIEVSGDTEFSVIGKVVGVVRWIH